MKEGWRFGADGILMDPQGARPNSGQAGEPGEKRVFNKRPGSAGLKLLGAQLCTGVRRADRAGNPVRPTEKVSRSNRPGVDQLGCPSPNE